MQNGFGSMMPGRISYIADAMSFYRTAILSTTDKLRVTYLSRGHYNPEIYPEREPAFRQAWVGRLAFVTSSTQFQML